MKLTINEISEALDMTVRGARKRAEREAWQYDEKSVRGGKKRIYTLSELPVAVQRLIVKRTQACENLTGGKRYAQKLQIKETLDRRLKASSSTPSSSQMALNPSQNNRIDSRLQVLRAWHTYQSESGKSKHDSATLFAELYNTGQIDLLPCVISVIPSVSGPSLLRWERQLKNNGTVRLSGNYGNRKGRSKIDDQEPLKDFIIGMIYEYPHAIPKHIYQALKSRFGRDENINMPSARSVERWLAGWKESNRQVLTAVTNPDEWKNKFMVAHGSLSEGVERLNQVWELDSTPADIMLTDGRHSIVGIIDVFSRRFKMIVSKTSKATTICAAVRWGILNWGVPEIAKTDNGKDYVGFHLVRVLADLGIEQILCPPFQPWHKPHIERAFRTFSHGLLEIMPGFIGHNVAERSAIQARQSFADRLFKKNEVIECNLTAQQLQEFCDRWCEQLYHHDAHGGLDGQSPFEIVLAYKGDVRTINNERSLDILLAEAPDNHGVRSVTKKGVRIKWDGEPRTHWYSAPELGLIVGEQVRIHYDPTGNMGLVYVFGDHGFICIAECPELLGLDRKEHATAAKLLQNKFINEGRAIMRDAAKRAKTKSAAEEILINAAENSNKVTALPKPSRQHSSDGLKAANNAIDALDASGAEPVSAEKRAALAQEMNTQATIKKLPETRQQRYLRWRTLQRTVDAEIPLSETDKKFWKGYRETAEWRSLRMMDEDFGIQDAHHDKNSRG